MFDPSQEPPLTMVQASRLGIIPSREEGKTVHPTTIWRWCKYGVRGVKLESLMCGQILCTSEAAIKRFFERLTTGHAVPTTAPTKAQRRRSMENADRILRKAGIKAAPSRA